MTTNLYKCTGCGEELRSIKSMGTHAQWSKTCTPQMRFWSKVDKSGGQDACWPWTAWVNPRFGYGMTAYKGESMPASRIAWIYTHGEPAKGEHVCHKCDNPICCNPGHFFLGTHYEKHIDKFLKHRDKRALHPDTVRAIRKALQEDTAYGCNKRVGDKFDVLSNVVSCIRRGKKYAYVK